MGSDMHLYFQAMSWTQQQASSMENRKKEKEKKNTIQIKILKYTVLVNKVLVGLHKSEFRRIITFSCMTSFDNSKTVMCMQNCANDEHNCKCSVAHYATPFTCLHLWFHYFVLKRMPLFPLWRTKILLSLFAIYIARKMKRIKLLSFHFYCFR